MLHVQDLVPQAMFAPRALQVNMAGHLVIPRIYIYVQRVPIALQGLVHLYYVTLEHTITHLERQESKIVQLERLEGITVLVQLHLLALLAPRVTIAP